jgi:hypothetical protein
MLPQEHLSYDEEKNNQQANDQQPQTHDTWRNRVAPFHIEKAQQFTLAQET